MKNRTFTVCLAAATLLTTACGGGNAPSTAVPRQDSLSPASTPTPTAVPAPVAQTARAADAFVDSIGVNTHLAWTTTPYYTNFAAVRTLLDGLGVRHIRDGVIDTTDQSVYAHFTALAADGIKTTAITAVSQTAAFLQQYPARIPGAIEAFEAPNEYDTSGDPNWTSTIANYQRTLYTALRSAPATAAYPVIGPSLVSAADYAAVGNLSAYLDFGNMHDYFAGFSPGTSGWGPPGFGSAYGSILWNIGSSSQVSGTKPIIATETGYQTCVATHGAVTPLVQGIYVPRMFLEQWNAGIARTLEYVLADYGTSCDQQYGIVDRTLTPKPAYVALKNLIARTSDRGGAFTPAPLSFALGGATANVHETLLGKRDGSYVLALWIETPSWDPNGGSDGEGVAVAVAPQNVTLALAAPPTGSVYESFNDDGTLTSRAISWNGAVASMAVSDRVSLLTLKPAAP